MTDRVLIADRLSPRAAEVFAAHGLEAETETGLDEAGLIRRIPEFAGLAVRSSTRVTEAVLDAAPQLRVIGRAGIGVDNIDVAAATRRGVVVMNTPFGNSITTAEHTIALMLSLARNIPAASASTHAGQWEKSRFSGVELYRKTLGLVGCGNIGAIVANRAIGLGMRVVVADPFLAEERATELGVEVVQYDDLLGQAGFHQFPRAIDRCDPQHDECGSARPLPAGGTDHQLCTRRSGGRGGPADSDHGRPGRGGGGGRVPERAGPGESPLRS